MRFRPQETNGLDPQGGPPFGFDGVGMRIYMCSADVRPLQALCEEFLTSVARDFGQTYTWTPIASGNYGLVMISVVTYDRMYSSPHPELGYTSQEELVFSVPVVKRTASGWPVDVAFFAPYCFVTDDWSIITGRSVLGYPKCEGWFRLPGVDPKKCPPYPKLGPKSPEYPIEVCARALRESAKHEMAEPELIFHVPDQAHADYPSIQLGDEPRKAWPFGPVEPIFVPSERALFPLEEERVVELLTKWAGVGAPQLALKQFRDVDSTTTACYQALVDFHVLLESLPRVGYLRLSEMRLHDYESLGIAKRLGLAGKPISGPGEVYSVTPFFAYWYRGNFSLKDDEAAALGGCSSIEGIKPPPSCDDLVGGVTDAVGTLATGQLEQWRRSGEALIQGRYGAADYGRDLREALDRSVHFGREMTSLYWQSLGHLTNWNWPGK